MHHIKIGSRFVPSLVTRFTLPRVRPTSVLIAGKFLFSSVMDIVETYIITSIEYVLERDIDGARKRERERIEEYIYLKKNSVEKKRGEK